MRCRAAPLLALLALSGSAVAADGDIELPSTYGEDCDALPAATDEQLAWAAYECSAYQTIAALNNRLYYSREGYTERLNGEQADLLFGSIRQLLPALKRARSQLASVGWRCESCKLFAYAEPFRKSLLECMGMQVGYEVFRFRIPAGTCTPRHSKYLRFTHPRATLPAKTAPRNAAPAAPQGQ